MGRSRNQKKRYFTLSTTEQSRHLSRLTHVPSFSLSIRNIYTRPTSEVSTETKNDIRPTTLSILNPLTERGRDDLTGVPRNPRPHPPYSYGYPFISPNITMTYSLFLKTGLGPCFPDRTIQFRLHERLLVPLPLNFLFPLK